MDIAKIEDVLYLARMNLFDHYSDLGDWRDAKVVSIIDDKVTLEKNQEQRTWTLDELEAYCLELNDQHLIKVLRESL